MKIPKPPQRVAVGWTRRCRCLAGCLRPAAGGGEQWTTCYSACESQTLPSGRAGQGKEEGTKETLPTRPGEGANVLRRARKGPHIDGGMNILPPDPPRRGSGGQTPQDIKVMSNCSSRAATEARTVTMSLSN